MLTIGAVAVLGAYAFNRSQLGGRIYESSPQILVMRSNNFNSPQVSDEGAYTAKFPKLQTVKWRDFEQDGFGSEAKSTLWLMIELRAPTKQPIKSLTGYLQILHKDAGIVFGAVIDHTPDVSFAEQDFHFVVIDPYDDSDAKHRVLRFGDKNDFKLTFAPTRVDFADGSAEAFK